MIRPTTTTWKLLGSDLWWTSIPSSGSANTSSRFMLQKRGYARAAMSKLAPRLHFLDIRRAGKISIVRTYILVEAILTIYNTPN